MNSEDKSCNFVSYRFLASLLKFAGNSSFVFDGSSTSSSMTLYHFRSSACDGGSGIGSLNKLIHVVIMHTDFHFVHYYFRC